MLDEQRLTPALGAVLQGVKWDEDGIEALSDAVYRALMEHQVVFIRQTDIKPEQHLAFAQAFGQLDEPHPLYPHVDGFDRIVKLENDSGAPPDTNSWHTDLTFTVSHEDADRAETIAKELVASVNAEGVVRDDAVAKVSIVGVGMRNHAGIAARMFRLLADASININVILYMHALSILL